MALDTPRETAEVFTFNETLTSFACPDKHGNPRIQGTRMEPISR